jgi:autotransporter strand-loop-strand O-heptosyltransferase
MSREQTNQVSGAVGAVGAGPSADAAVDTAQDDLAQQMRFFSPAAVLPTQQGAGGFRFDFNEGCRVVVPACPKGEWRVRLADVETGNILFEAGLRTGWVASSKKYFVPFAIEVYSGDKRVFEHRFCAREREVLIEFPVGTLGDVIGWMGYAVKFQRKHECRLTCAMAPQLIPLFQASYPQIRFVTPQQVEPERFYATYRLGLFFGDTGHLYQPTDFQLVGLHRIAGYILGLDPAEEAPQIADSESGRPLAERYVCIAVQSTTQCKYWNFPPGWREVVEFLKQHGYRVICIDQHPIHGAGLVWNHIPFGAEDYTGEIALVERARWLRHADFFVGLSSGLAWLAWAVGTPVVMISGCTHPINEFSTPYRVVNFHVCNSCWNDVRVRFDHDDFLWCPRHAGTARQFECTRLITAEQVIQTILRIPVFTENVNADVARD